MCQVTPLGLPGACAQFVAESVSFTASPKLLAPDHQYKTVLADGLHKYLRHSEGEFLAAFGTYVQRNVRSSDGQHGDR